MHMAHGAVPRWKISVKETMNMEFRKKCRCLLAACLLFALAAGNAAAGEADLKNCTFGVLPKAVGNEYWAMVGKGARQAGEELGIKVDYNGPTAGSTGGQTQFIDTWIQKGYCSIAVSAADAQAIAPALMRARKAGIRVFTFDADSSPAAREFFLSQAIPSGIAGKLADTMASLTGAKGDFLIITSTLTAPNQSEWIRQIELHIAKNYPDMKIAAILPGYEDNGKSRDAALGYLRANPNTTGIIAVTQSVPGLAEAKKQLGIANLPIIGIGPPTAAKAVLEDGSANGMVMWNPADLGYAAVFIQHAMVTGTLEPGTGNTVQAGRLGKLHFIDDDVILLGEPILFNKDNMAEFGQ